MRSTVNIKCAGFGASNDLFGAPLYRLVDKNIRSLAARFMSILSEQDIDDLVHDAWIHVNEHKASFKVGGNFEGGVYSICRNSVYSLCNKRAKINGKQTALPEDYEMKESPAFLDERDTDFPIIQSESVERIERGIQSLKPNRQKVVRLLIDEVPYKKMAVVIGCNENTVKTQVCRVRQELRAAI